MPTDKTYLSITLPRGLKRRLEVWAAAQKDREKPMRLSEAGRIAIERFLTMEAREA